MNHIMYGMLTEGAIFEYNGERYVKISSSEAKTIDGTRTLTFTSSDSTILVESDNSELITG